jgi:hypothetical protein
LPDGFDYACDLLDGVQREVHQRIVLAELRQRGAHRGAGAEPVTIASHTGPQGQVANARMGGLEGLLHPRLLEQRNLSKKEVFEGVV